MEEIIKKTRIKLPDDFDNLPKDMQIGILEQLTQGSKDETLEILNPEIKKNDKAFTAKKPGDKEK